MNGFIGMMASLGLGIALSPEVIVLGLWVVGQRENPLKKAWFFLSGGSAGILIFTAVGIVFASLTEEGPSWALFSMRMTTGTIMFLLGLILMFRKKKLFDGDRMCVHGIRPFTAFGLGLLSTGVNVKVASLSTVAGRHVSSFSGSMGIGVLGVALFLALGLLPMILPIMLETVKPGLVAKIIVPCNRFLEKYGRHVAVVICFAVAAFFWKRALSVMP